MISHLRLKNFKCFEDVTLQLGSLTLLSGLNGMGKSTVIQSILLLRQSFQQGLLPSVGLALNGELVHIGRGQDALYEYAESEQIGIELDAVPGKPRAWEFAYNPTADVLEILTDALDLSEYQIPLFRDDFQYLNAERIGPRAFYQMKDYEVQRHKQLGINGEYVVHFLSAFGKTIVTNERILHPRGNSNTLRDQTEAWLSEVSPGIQLHFQEHEGTDLISLQYSFVVGETTSNHYRPTNVGFGLTYTLSVVVALLFAKPGTLIILENPEAHLHPRGQSKIAEMLCRAAGSGVQLIVESHSDHVLNGIRKSVRADNIQPSSVELHYFTRSERNGKVVTDVKSPRVDINGRIDDWPDGFFDNYEKELLSLLLPRNSKP